MLAVSLYRVYGLSQIVEAVAFGDPRFRASPALIIFTVAVMAEGIVVLVICQRLQRVPAMLITVDTAVGCVALFLGAALISPRYAHTWMYYLYPYTMISCMAIGIAFRRLGLVLTATTVLAGSYFTAAVTLHHDPWWNALPNAISYYANTTVGWLVSVHLRRNARQLDESRDLAVAHADELARSRERERHARLLHDRVLQTLEALTRDGVLADQSVRRRVAAEAAWLRALVQQTEQDEDDLLSGLQRLVQQQALTGLAVELNTADLAVTQRRVAGAVTSALVDAACEALNNVGKHAGVDSAVMRVGWSKDTLTVTVLDHGCGFDPAAVCPGLGLIQSIHGRLNEVGGCARVDSAPGLGTYVELAVPRR